MKPPILIGITLAVVILAAAFVSPALRAASKKTAEKAQDQAALAERQLARYSLTMPRLDALANTGEMKKNEAELQEAVTAATAEPNDILPRAGREYADLVRQAQQHAQNAGLPAPNLPPLGTDAAGVQRALGEYQTMLQVNDALLKAALKTAQDAVNLDSAALGVPQALGMAQYVQAAGQLSEAEALRLQQANAQARLLDTASQWKIARGYLDHYRGLEVTAAVAQLQTDLEDVRKLREEAAATLKSVTAQVEEQGQRLGQAERELVSANESLKALEDRGFSAGDDTSFNAYRQEFLAQSERVRTLQQQVQELRHGTRQGMEPADVELASTEVQSGEVVAGLEELQRRLADAQERSKRFERATVGLNEYLTYVNGLGKSAEGETTRYQERLTELGAAQQALLAEVQTLATSAAEKEGQALQAANAAVRAFRQAQTAADAWLRAATELQRNHDPNRKNDRLRLVLADPYLAQVPRSAEAAAGILAARIYAQTRDCMEALLRDMRVLAAMNPDLDLQAIDAAKLQTEGEQAQAEGLDTLGKAIALYTQVSEKLANQPTKWVPLAGLAAAQSLMARLDPAQAAVHTSKALEFIQQALEKREQSPYLGPYVVFRDYLRGAAQLPKEPRSEPKQEPEKKPEEAGFFSDDDKQ